MAVVVKHYKVTALPAQCEADAIYYVNDGNFLLQYVTDSEGNPVLTSATNINKVDPVLVSRNLQASDNDAILLVKDNITLTFTDQLQSGFSCNIYVRGAYTCAMDVGTETIYATDGLEITEDGMGLIFRNGNEFILKT